MGRFIGAAGILLIVLAAYLLSNNRSAINWRTVCGAWGLQFLLAVLILKVPGTQNLFLLAGQGVEKLLDYAVDGAAFVFGDKLARNDFIFLVRIGSSIILVTSISALAYYLGIMQCMVQLAAKLLMRTIGITGPEAVSAASAVFVGQVECQTLIQPYIPRLTGSELFCSLTSAMATISGSALVAYTAMGMKPTHLIAASVMSAVGGIAMAKIFYPETQSQNTLNTEVEINIEHNGVNVFDALANGAMTGARIAANVMVMVLVAVALVALMNGLLGSVLYHFGLPWTIQDVLGFFFTPIACLLGAAPHEAYHVGRLMATEIMINEFAAYSELSKVIARHGAYVLSAKGQMIATMALCGFANLSSIGINIGGLGAMAPERRSEIAGMAFRALIAANFATWITAAMAGILF